MSSSSDFNKYGFAAGDVRGTRAWSVDKQGRLRGIVFEKYWRPGENIAQCLRFKEIAVSIQGPQVSIQGVTTTFSTSAFTTGLNFNSLTCPCGCGRLLGGGQVARELNPCSGMDPQCGCGFYGYQHGSNDYYSPGTGGKGPVGGVIRGYGKVILGTRGFRAEKVEILALYIDAEKLQMADHKLDDGLIRARLAHNYGVPIFEDYQQLLTEFPPDMPERDDSFWEKS